MNNQVFVAFCVGGLCGIVIGIMFAAIAIAIQNRIEGKEDIYESDNNNSDYMPDYSNNMLDK